MTAELDTPVQWVQERPLEIERTGAAQAQARPCPPSVTPQGGWAALHFWHCCLQGRRPCEYMQCKRELERLHVRASACWRTTGAENLNVDVVCRGEFTGYLM